MSSMYVFHSIVDPCRICGLYQRIYHTFPRGGRGLISTLAPFRMFTFAKYLYSSHSVSEDHGQSVGCSSIIDRQVDYVTVNIQRSHSGCLAKGSDVKSSECLGTSVVDSGGLSIARIMGIGCIMNRRRPVMTVQQGPVRKFSVTTSLDVTSTIPASSTELAAFDKLFTHIVEDLTKEMFPQHELATVFDWFAKVLQYNVPNGKKNRGLAVVESFKHLLPSASPVQLHQARVLGWCVELLQAYYLIADDIMDQSLTRRGRPCWYKQEGVGSIAINDSFYLNACLYQLLGKHFRQESYYCHLLDLFHEVDMRTVIGQGLDLLTSPTDGSVDLNAFSMRRYDTIVTWKTAYYSFYLPVALAMYMAGITDTQTHQEAKVILLQMGHFFQVQDDFLDCYGDPSVTGKIGSDIEDNKCSWLINRALNLCNEQQRQILDDNYGRNDPPSVGKVKDVYNDLDLEKEFRAFERTSFENLTKLIVESHSNLPKRMFTEFADKIYKREK